eukprot:TRINITY_DN105263_c0_g1_i1.p1 TRINITY_DN105263_c0_g1~~TRINITY_DN105263_c0_g1_i1.p1  ORF type:complete len:153 (+),score=21.47 TRINITY_DN105263_c0_g1_i1:93-551(+)
MASSSKSSRFQYLDLNSEADRNDDPEGCGSQKSMESRSHSRQSGLSSQSGSGSVQTSEQSSLSRRSGLNSQGGSGLVQASEQSSKGSQAASPFPGSGTSSPGYERSFTTVLLQSELNRKLARLKEKHRERREKQKQTDRERALAALPRILSL